MDALAQKRGESLDVTRQLLTTSMLPKIAKLYERGRVLFFMATNHVGGLDDAITRAGRFDLFVCVGPPSWKEKLSRLDTILVEMKLPSKEVKEADESRNVLRNWVKPAPTDELCRALDLFTYDEFSALLRQIRGRSELLINLKKLGKEDFRSMVQQWSTHIKLREEDRWRSNTLRYEFEEDKLRSRVQY